ncbi:MAG: hypothetical protein QXQ53_01295 [Candidatus Methanosuratincola sp.]
MSDNLLKKGNICVLKRPLADFLVVVEWVSGDDVSIRYLDSPRDAGYNVVKKDELIKLSDEQERMLPADFLAAVNKQRQVLFSPKKSLQTVAQLLRTMSAEQEELVFKILASDGVDEEVEEK